MLKWTTHFSRVESGNGVNIHVKIISFISRRLVLEWWRKPVYPGKTKELN